MAVVNITINRKAYGVACDDGQEERVKALAAYVDERVRGIAGAGAAVGEAHSLVLAAIVLADEVFDLKEHCDAIAQSGSSRPTNERVSAQEEELIVRAIETLTNRIHHIAGTATGS